jgi:hypothetical protein
MQYVPKRFKLFAFGEATYGEEGFEFFLIFLFLGEKEKESSLLGILSFK